MKQILFALLLLVFITRGYSQQAAYSLPLPAKWGVEKIPFPISFAPQIPFKGNEEIRFTPGWGDKNSEEYWSYTFLWFIEGTPRLNQDTLQHYLTEYFTGLYLTNQKTKPSTPPGGFTNVQFNKVAAAANDAETYEGKITTLNFLTGLQINFNARVHVRNYVTGNQSALLVEISPQAYPHPVWGKLDSIVNGFQLNK